MKKFDCKYLTEEKTKSVSGWIKYLNEAPQSIVTDTITYYANKRRNWNLKKYGLTKPEIKDLQNFMKALDSTGVKDKEFMSYVTV